MKKSTILCAALAAISITFAGCSKDEGDKQADGRTALTVNSGIQTRAYDNTWETDDAIGIYMFGHGTNIVAEGAANRKYTTAAGGTNGVFAPATADQTIYYPVDGSTTDLVAYYPHATLSGTTYNVNVTDQTSQKAIDLMAAAKVMGKHKNDPEVVFAFEHKLVKLDITIKADGKSLSTADLNGTKVEISNQQTAATYNVVTGGDVNVTTGASTNIALLTATNGLKAEGVVLPNASTDDMKLTFTVPTLKQTFKWTIKNASQSQQFAAGKKYKYTITIAKAGVSVTSTVTDWTPGNGVGGETGSAE